MNLKIGDPVVCYKIMWGKNEWRRGIIFNIKYWSDLNNNRVYYYEIRNDEDRFNIFPPHESIILDKQTLREDKLKEIGI